MKGFVCIDPIGIDSEKGLEYWIKIGLDFNLKAQSSNKPSSAKKPKSALVKKKGLK